jgi:rRNA-processing protein FCF1
VSKPHRFVAVDTEVLLAIEAGDEDCTEAIDRLTAAGFYCLVTETPLQELGEICQLTSDSEAAERAKATLTQITNFGFLESRLGVVEMGVAERVALRICELCLLDHGTMNDGLVMAEAAYNNCRILLTRRKTLLASKTDSLQIALVDFDLNPVVVASPTEIVNYYTPKKQ